MEDSTLDMGSYFGKPKKSAQPTSSSDFKNYSSALAPITEEPVPRTAKPPRGSNKKLQAIAGGFGKQTSSSNLTLIGHKNTASRRNLTGVKPGTLGQGGFSTKRKSKSTIRGRSLYNTPHGNFDTVSNQFDSKSIDHEVEMLLQRADAASAAEKRGLLSDTDRIDEMHRNGDAEDILAYSEQILNQFKAQHTEGYETKSASSKAHVTLKKKASNADIY